MTTAVPELSTLPKGLVLDGELVAFNSEGAPDWPMLCERVLHGNRSIAAVFVAFDVLRVDGHDVMCITWTDRRSVLEELGVGRWCVRPADVFDDGEALYDAVVSYGLEGVVAKRTNGTYRPGCRGWTRIKNPSYWRRESELAGVGSSRSR